MHRPHPICTPLPFTPIYHQYPYPISVHPSPHLLLLSFYIYTPSIAISLSTPIYESLSISTICHSSPYLHFLPLYTYTPPISISISAISLYISTYPLSTYLHLPIYLSLPFTTIHPQYPSTYPPLSLSSYTSHILCSPPSTSLSPPSLLCFR